MAFGTVNVGQPGGEVYITKDQIGKPGGVAGIGSDGKIPADLLPETGGGFVEMKEEIPVEQRKANTLYALIQVDFKGKRA